ncbi:hypothetical protein JG687_00019296, partial [Phytophthora cactorum]
MHGEENRVRTLTRLEKKKRAGDDLEDLDVVLKDRRVPDIRFSRKFTSTTSDNEQSRLKLLWIVVKNQDMLESNGLKKSITPIFKQKLKSDESGLKQYVWVKMGSIDVYGRDSNLKHKSAINKVDWQSTLRAFLEMIKSRGLNISMVGASDAERSIKSYEATGDDDNREARHDVKTGLDEDRD